MLTIAIIVSTLFVPAMMLALLYRGDTVTARAPASSPRFYRSPFSYGWMSAYILLIFAGALMVNDATGLALQALCSLPILCRCVTGAMYLRLADLERSASIHPDRVPTTATTGGMGLTRRGAAITCIMPSCDEPVDVMIMTTQSILNAQRPGRLQFISVDNSLDPNSPALQRWRTYLADCSATDPDIDTLFMSNPLRASLKPGNVDYALTQAASEFILFIDVDSTLSSQSPDLATAVEMLRSDIELAFVQFRVVPTNVGFNCLTRGVGRYQYLHNATDYIGGMDGFAMFKGHNALWRRDALDRLGCWVSRIQGRVVLAEDFQKTCESYGAGYRGAVVWSDTGEWLPMSFPAFESMWRRWIYGTWQVARVVLRKTWTSGRLSTIERFELLRRQQFGSAAIPYVIAVIAVIRPHPVLLPYLAVVVAHFLIGRWVTRQSGWREQISATPPRRGAVWLVESSVSSFVDWISFLATLRFVRHSIGSRIRSRLNFRFRPVGAATWLPTSKAVEDHRRPKDVVRRSMLNFAVNLPLLSLGVTLLVLGEEDIPRAVIRTSALVSILLTLVFPLVVRNTRRTVPNRATEATHDSWSSHNLQSDPSSTVKQC